MKKITILLLAAFTGFGLTGCLKEDVNASIGIVNPITTVEQVRSLYRGSDVTISSDRISGASKISGVVVSDAASKNITPGNVVIQNYGRGIIRGITIALGETATVPVVLGDSVQVDVLGSTLTVDKGSLVIKGLKPENIKKIASNVVAAVKSVSLVELQNNFAAYEGMLVQVNADIKPTPVLGETYSGDKTLNDGTAGIIRLHTQTDAAFATAKVPASAAFTGIALYNNDTANKQIWMRNLQDVKNASGPLYAGYPEDFEFPDQTLKASYAAANIGLKTGNWRLDNAILANTSGRDRFNPAGLQCIRMQQNLSVSAYVQMNYDLPNGATKITLSYGAYYTDASSTWRLEYSTDQGVTWKQTGNDISDAGPVAKTATFLMNISGPVRFRVNKLGLGNTAGSILNGRLSIEDIAIFRQ